MKVLIDTNIILDAMISREPFSGPAKKIFLLSAEDKITGSITANTVTDIYYLLNRHLHDHNQCREALRKLFIIFDVLDVIGSDCETALQMPIPDYEDALLVACAKRHKVDCIITRNLKDFVSSPVKTLSPDIFLKGSDS